MIDPARTVAILWTILMVGKKAETHLRREITVTYAPSVIPAKPKIFWGLSLKLDVKLPVYQSSCEVNGTEKTSRAYTVSLLIEKFDFISTVRKRSICVVK
jgi:hypothetical protein